MVLRIILAILLINLAACASAQKVGLPAAGQLPDGVELYDQVELTTVGGSTHEFVVSEINELGLGGTPGFFEYQDIRELKVKVQQGDDGDIWAVLVGVALIGLLGAGAMAGAEAAGASSLLGGGG